MLGKNKFTDRNLPIGFCDSGVGGLSVFSKCRALMPNEDTIYYGDLANVPYGSKSREELFVYLTEILNFFVGCKVKAVVLACNTTSAVVYEYIKDKYPFVIYPIIQSSAKLLGGLNIKRLGVFATQATINSKAYEREIRRHNWKMEVFTHACPGWVEIVENKTQGSPESLALIEQYVNEMMKHEPEKIVLGCTHYPFLKESLYKFVKPAMLIDPSEYFARFIESDLEQKNLRNLSENKGKEEFYVSANPEQFQISGSTFYDIKTLPTLL